jgi:hypothetical protein
MGTLQSRPEVDICMEVTGQIVSGALASGKLSTNVSEVVGYFSELYPQILEAYKKALRTY